MDSVKIVRAINIGTTCQIFAPEFGEEPRPVYIHPDKNGEMWYWTPELDESIAAK